MAKLKKIAEIKAYYGCEAKDVVETLENNSLWVDDVAGNSVRLKFKGNNVVFDNKTNIFSVSNDKINVTYDDDYLDDDVKDMYKKLHYTYAEIALNYGNRIHYNLV